MGEFSLSPVTNYGVLSALNDTVELDLAQGQNVVGIQITGTFEQRIIFEASLDGTYWAPFHPMTLNGDETANLDDAFTDLSKILIAQVGGVRKIRVTCDLYTSGDANILLRGHNSSSRQPFGATILGQISNDVNDLLDIIPLLYAVDMEPHSTVVPFGDLSDTQTLVFTSPSLLKFLRIHNTTDADVLLSFYGDSETYSLYIPAGETVPLDLKANSLQMQATATIHAKRLSAPTFGNLIFNCM